MIRNEGKLPYEKNQIINYARQEISIQLIFSVLMRAHLSISFAIIRCKMLKTYKRGTLKEKWTVMTFQASSFLYFQTYSILCFGSAKRERFFQRLAISFLCNWIHSTRSKHLISCKSTLYAYILYNTPIYFESGDTRYTLTYAQTRHTQYIHALIASIKKETFP